MSEQDGRSDPVGRPRQIGAAVFSTIPYSDTDPATRPLMPT